MELEPGPRRAGWHEIELESADDPSVKASGRVLVPPDDARFAVISDIDDTVVYTHVMSKLRMLVTVAFSNAHTRKPFEGVAAFYRALHAGRNPFFYVSKSPWNLYVPLAEYLELQGLPEGPLFLRNLGLRMPRDHKCAAISALLAAYPRLPFILIGDSGENDPEVYHDILRRHPSRIRVIYIRSVNRQPRRLAALEKLIAEVAKTGCQLVLAPDSEHAAAHAAAEGLISATELRPVRAEKNRDLRT
jgi:phosphatidate phosphatase APP1